MDNSGLPVSISIIISGVIIGLLIFAGFIVSAVISGSFIK
jgi:hypothetical protein